MAVPKVAFTMMGELNIASWALLIGAWGQMGFYGLLFPRLPTWAIMAPLYLPWLTVYVISFCRVAPFGPRPFRYCLTFAMCWYAVMTLLAEGLYLITRPVPLGHLPILAVRLCTYLAALSFTVFVRVCIQLRRYELNRLD
jgi:hypothetical protein